jgi:SAM-dependent methyltransferase
MRFVQRRGMHNEIDPSHATANEVRIGNRTHVGRKGRIQQIQPCDLVLSLPQSPDKSLSEVTGASSHENLHRNDKPLNAATQLKLYRYVLYNTPRKERDMTSFDEMPTQPDAARQRSRATWDAVATGWYTQREEIWESSRPVSEWMIRRLDPQPGDTVLELAAGLGDTGLRAARSVGRSGRVIITDFAPEMVAAARRRAEEMGVENAEFRTLDAERMDLETNSVDGVLCRWAYMLMIDPAAAFAETRRVLRPGGRLAFSVWAARERNPALSLAGRILVELGHILPPDPEAPGPFFMADTGRIRELVVGAGFAEPAIEEVSFSRQFVNQDAYWRFLIETSASTSPVLRSLPPEAQNTVRERVHEAARPFHSGEGYDFPGVCLNAVTY